MSSPQEPLAVKLVIGLFMKERELLDPFARKLVDNFGPPDLISRWAPFNFTSYYNREMGGPLFRRLFSFEKLVMPDRLADIKIRTNKLEGKYLENGARRVNADPGILSLERFVLATGKNFTHRIYLTRGIFADLTLIFTKGSFQTLPWTYPDYESREILSFLQKVREKYIVDLKKSAEKKHD